MTIRSIISKRLVAYGLSAATAISGGYLIVPWEGSVKNKQGLHTVYLDSVGVPTACYGQTGKDLYGRTIQMGITYTEDECIQMLATTLKKFEKEVDKAVKVKYASPWQKAALISFTYNVGTGNLLSSTLLRKLNSGQHKESCEQLTKWVYAKKTFLQGLFNRRSKEMAWCMGDVPYEAKATYLEIAQAMVKEGTEK